MTKSLSTFERNLIIKLITSDDVFLVNRHFLQCDWGVQCSDGAAPSLDAHRTYMSVRSAWWTCSRLISGSNALRIMPRLHVVTSSQNSIKNRKCSYCHHTANPLKKNRWEQAVCRNAYKWSNMHLYAVSKVPHWNWKRVLLSRASRFSLILM